MNGVHPLIRIGGPILGVLILFYAINSGVSQFQSDLEVERTAQRLAAEATAQALLAEEAAVATDTAAATPVATPIAEAELPTAEVPAPAEESAEARVFFRQPTDNAVVPETFVVKMGAEGLTVEPSGEVNPNAGHMHVLVDTDFVPVGEVIPSDEQHLHFGDGSQEAELTLPPGEHILRLQFADGAHTALEGDTFRDEIIVTVEEGAAAQAVRFVQPGDGETVTSPVEVVMAATGLVVEPAGEINENEDAGHLHILVNTDFVPAGEVIPNDEQHRHFGGGQLTASLELPSGEHILRLQLADGAHTALEGDAYRDTVVIAVMDAEVGGTPEAEGGATPVAEETAAATAEPIEEATPEPEPTATPEPSAEAEGSGAAAAEPLSPEIVELAVMAMTNAGCGGCHVIPGVPGAVGVVGPNQSNLGAYAGDRIEGYTAEEYIRESILMPNAYIAEECPTGPCIANIMPQNYGELLSDEEVDAVVAYLASLREEE